MAYFYRYFYRYFNRNFKINNHKNYKNYNREDIIRYGYN